MSQIDKLRNKLLLQAQRVMKKIKPKRDSREISNSELTIALFQYAVSGDIPDEYGLKREWLHDKLAKLTPEQMELIRLRFFEGLSYNEIGKSTGHNQKYAERHLKEALDVLRQAKD